MHVTTDFQVMRKFSHHRENFLEFMGNKKSELHTNPPYIIPNSADEFINSGKIMAIRLSMQFYKNPDHWINFLKLGV